MANDKKGRLVLHALPYLCSGEIAKAGRSTYMGELGYCSLQQEHREVSLNVDNTARIVNGVNTMWCTGRMGSIRQQFRARTTAIMLHAAEQSCARYRACMFSLYLVFGRVSNAVCSMSWQRRSKGILDTRQCRSAHLGHRQWLVGAGFGHIVLILLGI